MVYFEWVRKRGLNKFLFYFVEILAKTNPFLILKYLLSPPESGSPISIFQIPSFCGYSVKASWTELEIIVPYDGCYTIQEVSGAKVVISSHSMPVLSGVLFIHPMSEWKSCAAHGVVGEPSEAVLPDDDIHGYSYVLPVCSFCLLLCLWHGSTDSREGA